MTLGTVKLSMMIAAVICLPSCGPHSVDLVPNNEETPSPAGSNSAVPAITVKSEAEKLEPEYQYDAQLKKIDREWFVATWTFIVPDFAFKLNKGEDCEQENDYEAIFIFKSNGTVLHRDKLENRGSWTFSDNMLKLQIDNFDEDGKKLEPILPIFYHVGKASERIAILTTADGRLAAMMKCLS